MTTEPKTSGNSLNWSDPLSMGFEAHRRLLLLRLRIRGSAKRERHGLLAARRNRSTTESTAATTSGGSSTSNSAPTVAK
jgi:hypothetical protein